MGMIPTAGTGQTAHAVVEVVVVVAVGYIYE